MSILSVRNFVNYLTAEGPEAVLDCSINADLIGLPSNSFGIGISSNQRAVAEVSYVVTGSVILKPCLTPSPQMIQGMVISSGDLEPWVLS